MTEVERIADQYDRAMNGDAWHGDPVWKILEGISAEQAARRAEASTHTIWELVSHMTFWETEVCRRINGLAPRSTEEFNFPAMPGAAEENWNRVLSEFRTSNASFRQCLSKLDAGRLDQIPPGRNKSIYVDLHGVIQHHIYHAGQIAVLRRFLAQK